MDLRDYDDKDRKERIARRQSRVLPKRFEQVQEEIDLRTGVLWTSHAKAVDLVGNKVVESSVEAPEMLWFDRSVEMPEPDYIPGDLIPSELYAPEERDYSVPALQRMEHERRQCMARDSMPGLDAVRYEGEILRICADFAGWASGRKIYLLQASWASRDAVPLLLDQLGRHQLLRNLDTQAHVQRTKGHEVARLRSHVGNGEALSQNSLVGKEVFLMHQVHGLGVVDHLTSGKQERCKHFGGCLKTTTKASVERAPESRRKVTQESHWVTLHGILQGTDAEAVLGRLINRDVLQARNLIPVDGGEHAIGEEAAWAHLPAFSIAHHKGAVQARISGQRTIDLLADQVLQLGRQRVRPLLSHVAQNGGQGIACLESMTTSNKMVWGKKRPKICKPARSICCLRCRACSSIRS